MPPRAYLTELPQPARWALLWLGLAVVILLPFWLFGARFDDWSVTRLQELAGRPGAVASLIVALLAADVLLPVPSSIVATMGGALLGVSLGAAAVWLGMTTACAVAYALGRYAGTPTVGRLVGAGEAARLQRLAARHGDWSLVLARPVPVLAEASTMLAGASAIPFGRFLAVTAGANLGIALVYGAVGAFAASAHSFLLAFAAAVLVPLAGKLLLGGRS